VRNPLGAADGYLDLIESGVVAGEAKRKEFMTRSRRALSSAMGLLDDLVELSLAEAGQIEVRLCAVDVRDVIGEITKEHRARASAKELELECHVPEQLPLVQTDAARVRQILGNLISNAIKYTRTGRIDVSIVPAERGWIGIAVQDTGSGIAADQRGLLFREFTRLDPDAAEGAGLGLAISQRVAHALGGRITVESEPGRGSIFTLWLPGDAGAAS
jgi:signal transduction histidine kinase